MSKEIHRQILPLFSRPIFIIKGYTLNEEEMAAVQKERNSVNDNAGKNYTSQDSYIFNKPEFKNLATWIKKELDIYFYDCLQLNKSTQLRFSQSWLNYNPKGTFHHVHTHPNSIVSGVYFIKGDQQPILFERFENDHLFGNIIPEVDKYNYYNCGSWKVTNKPGYLLLFPSSVKHGVVMNEATEERISLSFNTFVTGTIGKNRGLTELKI
tara:strand:- start:212 stop:841 length:630 start_codon:yes stop_codon:yes gene_type:complete